MVWKVHHHHLLWFWQLRYIYQRMVCVVITCSAFVFKCQGLVSIIMYRSGWLFLSYSRPFGFDKNTATKCVANSSLPCTQSVSTVWLPRHPVRLNTYIASEWKRCIYFGWLCGRFRFRYESPPCNLYKFKRFPIFRAVYSRYKIGDAWSAKKSYNCIALSNKGTSSFACCCSGSGFKTPLKSEIF